MIKALNSENFVDGVFCSYEARIQGVERLLETARSILENFDNSLLSVHHEYEHISEQLRDNLAQNGSLRKKDFDRMMRVVSADQDQRGQDVRDLSRKCLDEQTQLVHELRGRLREFTGALAEGEAEKVTEHHEAITNLLKRQQQRSDDVVTRLKESQEEQQQTAGMLRGLLAKGRALRIEDLTTMLAEFKRQRGRRLMQQGQRREEVQDMLREFRVQRVEAEQDRRAQAAGRQKGDGSSETCHSYPYRILSNGGTGCPHFAEPCPEGPDGVRRRDGSERSPQWANAGLGEPWSARARADLGRESGEGYREH